MSQKGFRTAKRRYLYLFWPLMAVYVVAVFAASWAVDEESSALWMKVVAAMAITLPLLGVLFAVRRQTVETDEYTRMRQLNALRDAGLITTGLLFAAGFLQLFEAIPNFSAFWFGVAFFFAYGLSDCTRRFSRIV